MPRTHASILAALTLACPLAAQTTTPATTPAKAYSGTLPVVPGAGDPAPEGQVFAVEVLPDGTIRRGGKRLTTAELETQLSAFAKAHPGRKLGTLTISKARVLARLHPELPYAVLYQFVGLCARPGVAIPRVDFAVRATAKGAERTVPIVLPMDGGVDVDVPSDMLSARLEFAGRPLTAKSLAATLAATLAGIRPLEDAKAGGKKPPLLLVPDRNVSVQTVLRVVHAARAAGIPIIHCGSGDTALRWEVRELPDFGHVLRDTPKRPDREPRLRLDGLRSVAEVEEEGEELPPGKRGKRDQPDKPVAKGFNTAVDLGGAAGGRYGNRNRPPAGADVPAKVAIGLALQWLARHQDEDGRWDADEFMKHDRKHAPADGAGGKTRDIGVTGLALLAFLGDGNTLRAGPHRDVVKKGVKWLRSQQDRRGLFGTMSSQDFIYHHAIATVAMCEAYGLSQYQLTKETAQRAIDYLESHRNPYAAWRYQPRDNDNDISVTSWCLMAYRAASDFGLSVNPAAFKIGVSYIDQLTDPATGRCGYSRRGEPSARNAGGHATRFPADKGEAMTAAALFLRFMLGQDPKHVDIMTRSADTLLQTPPRWKDDGSIDFYYWYYGTYAMYQMGGKHWETWRKAVMPAVLPHQRKDGNFVGSWDPVGVWGEAGGRVYSTAMAALTLEAVYRYVRLVK